MLVYFEFEDKRRKANVHWPRNGQNIVVHITDPELAKDLPTDLYYEMEDTNKVTFIIEDQDNKRLLELQNVLKRRLQEFANKS
jgi:hypothetical protein